MPHYLSNQPLYQLHFSELEQDLVKVLFFEGEESLSRPFEYRFDLLSEDPGLEAKKILDRKAAFSITRGAEQPLQISGIIARFEQRGRTPDYVAYHAVLVPKLWRLHLTYQSEIYQRMSIAQLIPKVLQSSGFSGEDYEIRLSKSYPAQEYVTQYRETNFHFLNRRLEHWGIFYFFEQHEDNEVVVFADANDAFPAIASGEALDYNPNKDPFSEKETVDEITTEQKIVTGLVRLKDYNYLHPEKQLMAESRLDAEAPGMYYEFGDHFEDDAQAEFLARVRNEEILAGSTIAKGKSDCRLFRAGHRFTLAQHYRDEWNAAYVLQKVSSRGAQSGLFGILPFTKAKMPAYENYFEAIPEDIAFRPARRTPIPRIPGIMSAKIESGSGDEYAFIDDHGRYRAKMLFDVTETANGEATLPIRLSQGYSGSGYGMHFPNHAGTELVWACLDGNVDRPMGLGTVPNPSNASPATGGNKAQSVIRTAGQNELTLDDTTGSENIYLHATKDWTIEIVNDKNQTIGHDETASVGNNRSRNVGNDESIAVGNNRNKSVGVDQYEAIGSNKTIQVGANHTETIGADKTISVAANHAETIGGSMTQTIAASKSESVGASKSETIAIAKALSIGAAYQVSVGAAMNETVGGAKAEEIGGAKMVNVGLVSMENVGLNKSVNAGGNLSESAGKKMTLSAKDELLLKCGDAMIQLKSSGDILIKGKGKITIQADGGIINKGPQIAQN